MSIEPETGAEKPKSARTTNPFRKGVRVIVTKEPDQVPINYQRLSDVLDRIHARKQTEVIKEPSPQERDENFDFWAS
jgi:hypothetical protein